VRCHSILDAVEDLHGPDLLCWTTNFFIKEAADPAFVSWHQDATYWGLSEPDVVTAWVAFTPATEANGAMEYIPGSHRLDQIPHRDTFAKHNLLTRARRSWSGSTFPAADHHPASRRDVAAPRAPRSRLPAEPIERLAHQLRHPLYPD
jgi:ectoine hydroxylase-related dioxygenase (phytanoyl-CoA dioxygenase family)